MSTKIDRVMFKSTLRDLFFQASEELGAREATQILAEVSQEYGQLLAEIAHEQGLVVSKPELELE